MKVYVIRHGESEGNRLQMNCGWCRTPLSEQGRLQAERLGRALQGIRFDCVYCSDLVRAKETCAIALPGYTPQYSPLLREIGVGTLADVSIEENAKRFGTQYAEAVQTQDFRQFGGESQEEMQERVQRFFRELEKTDAEKVAVVGHEGTVHQLFNMTVGYPVLLEHLQIENASVTVFSFENGVWKLLKFSCLGNPDEV